MLLRNRICLAVGTLCLAMFAGCGDSEELDASAEASEVAEATEFAALSVPEEAPQQFRQMYEQARQVTTPAGIQQFAKISEIVGQKLTMAGDVRGEGFFKQAATLMRNAKEAGATIDPAAFGRIMYFESRLLAKEGSTELAMQSLEEAAAGGFTDWEAVEQDPALAAIREFPGFSKSLEEWKATTKERFDRQAAEALATNEPFPFDFSMTMIDGSEVSKESLEGKVVLVNLWGTWCGPCLQELPALIQLQDEFGEQGLQIIGMNYNEQGSSRESITKKLVEFAKAKGMNYPTGLGTPAVQRMIPNFQGYPTTILLDRSGKVRLMFVGARDHGFFESVVSQLLSEDA